MRKFRVLAILLFALHALAPRLHAQSTITLTPPQCVWHAGDNPAWAATNFDDSAWQPYSTWKIDAKAPRIWVRCHTSLAALRSLAHPALQVHLHAASQVFVNGIPAGSFGNIATAQFNLADYYTVPLTSASLTPNAVIALRIAFRDLSIPTMPAEILLGDQAFLHDHRAAASLFGALGYLPIAICFALIGVVGFMLFGLYANDRSHLELLLLAIVCWLLCILRLSEFCEHALVPMPFALFSLLYGTGNLLEIFWIWFMFSIAGKHIPWFYRVAMALTTLAYAGTLLISPFLSQLVDLRQQAFYYHTSGISFIGGALCATAPMVAFWPWNRIARGRRAVAFFCIAWGCAEFLWFVNWELWALGESDALNLLVQKYLLILRAATTLCSVLALLTILFREQRRIAEDRALLAGEMASAREIQQYLIPEELPPALGLNIRSIYQPSREVGGDFFQILPDPRDGSTLIVVGDVAGKGLRAGMLAALIVGAIRTAFQFTAEPGRILALLNERLQGRGLVTCLAVRVNRDGSAVLANAGHPPPYIDGKELPLDGSLPLGALPDISFPQAHIRLNEGQSMLLLSDGVLEARNAQGELFGFERTAAISTQSAESIAHAAQTFGQEDDITVLTIEFAGAGVAHA